jgi:hypothetical protein
MRRVVAILLLLPAFAAAQGVEEWIDIALDARTAPEQRVDALKKLAQAKDGLDRLAEKGLDARRDPEVVHAVVDTLLRSSDYRPYLERMCRLLLSEKHREKVLRRFQSLWEADRGQALLDALVAIARSPDAQLREAAIVALGIIPRRRAAETIVEAGLAATEEPVKAAARAYVQLWFGVATLREASEYLQGRKLDSFYDLVKARIEALSRAGEEHERTYARFLEKASPLEALDELEKGGVLRVYAARRIAKLAEQNGIQDPVEFARRVFDGLVAELGRAPPDASVLAQLLTALHSFAQDQNGPLWRARKPEEVRDMIQRLADVPGTGAEHQQLGSVAVRLLGAIDDRGLALFAFAERFPSAEARKEAIQQLGQLASRLPERQQWISVKLVGLLAGTEKEPAFRAMILNLLTQPHIPVSTEPDEVQVVRGYLEKGAVPDLTDAELRDCALVLGKARTPAAKEALLKAASSHAKPQARRYALEEGLVPWARSDESIHLELTAIALAPEQPLDGRRAVVEALGKRGGRRAAATLDLIEQDKAFDPALAGAVKEAKLQLLKRLANGEGAAADAPDQKPADLEAALRILEQEIAGDPDRLEALAGALVRACDAAKIPAATARYRLAWLYARLPPERMKEPTLLQRYEEAAANAGADKLLPALREEMLRDYRDLLLKDKANTDRMREAATCAEELAELALAERNKEKAARHYLDAAESYLALGNRQRAKELLDKATGTGGVAGELVARERELRARLT